MIAELAAAALAGVGVYLLVTPRRPTSRRATPDRPLPGRSWPGRRGVGGVEVPAGTGHRVQPGTLAAAAVVAVVGGALTYLVFGGPAPAVAGGVFAAGFPLAARRAASARELSAAAEAWPGLLEELRLLTGSAGRSIPQALVEAGRRAPAPFRPAFDAAEREWLLTTDFIRMTDVLRDGLADPTADAVCETLIVANEVGGRGLEHRLGELIEDRRLEIQGRKDAAAKQAGVRFARRFVLVVPMGMALAGLAIGTGRAAYATPGGQVAVVVAVAGVAACWWWSGRLLRLPVEPRVFARAQAAAGPVSLAPPTAVSDVATATGAAEVCSA